MNSTNLYHSALALACQAAVAFALRLVGVDTTTACAMGGLLAAGFYWGREVAQAEAKAGGTPWWIGFDVTKWSADAICDLAFPLAACALVTTLSIVL